MSLEPSEAARAYIASKQDTFIEELRRLCRQPSIGLENLGMEECAEMVRSIMERRGISTRILRTNSHPVVYGEIQGASDRTLLMYGHYDVLPPGPLDKWESPPFEANVVGDRIIGRGVADHKGSFLARVQAVETLLQQGPLPVTVKFLIEGDEEVGSPDLWDVVMGNRELLRADAALYPACYKDERGRPLFNAGSRGSIYLELVARGPNRDLHGRHAPLAPNPLWRINRALATLVDETDEVQIAGFYDDVDLPSEADIQALRNIPFDGPAVRASWGIDSFVGGVDGLDALQRNMFRPSCSLRAITTDNPSTQVIHSTARATLCISMVPRQRPEDILSKLRAHLDSKGFGDVEVKVLRLIGRPARVPLTERIVSVVAESARAVYGQDPVIQPITSSSGPRYVFIDGLGVPMVPDAGVRHAGSNEHGANENVRIDDYLDGILHIADIIRRF